MRSLSIQSARGGDRDRMITSHVDLSPKLII